MKNFLAVGVLVLILVAGKSLSETVAPQTGNIVAYLTGLAAGVVLFVIEKLMDGRGSHGNHA